MVFVVVMGTCTWLVECASRFCCGCRYINEKATLPGPSVL